MRGDSYATGPGGAADKAGQRTGGRPLRSPRALRPGPGRTLTGGRAVGSNVRADESRARALREHALPTCDALRSAANRSTHLGCSSTPGAHQERARAKLRYQRRLVPVLLGAAD